MIAKPTSYKRPSAFSIMMVSPVSKLRSKKGNTLPCRHRPLWLEVAVPRPSAVAFTVQCTWPWIFRSRRKSFQTRFCLASLRLETFLIIMSTSFIMLII